MAKQELAPSEAREVLFQKMTVELQEVALKIQQRESIAAKGTLELGWRTGKLIKDVLKDTAAYGSNAVDQLAAYLGHAATTLYSLRDIYDDWKLAEIQRLGQTIMANGQPFSLRHAQEATRVKEKEAREQVVEQCIAQGWSVADLVAHIRGTLGRQVVKRYGGRKVARPGSPIIGLQQLITNSKTLNSKLDMYQNAVFDELDQIPSQKASPDLRDRLLLAEEQLVALQMKATANLSRTRSVLSRLERMLQNGHPDNGQPVLEGAVADSPRVVRRKVKKTARAKAAAPKTTSKPAKTGKRRKKRARRKIAVVS